MKLVFAVLRELAGLFVEDGALALAIVAVVAVAGITAGLAPVGWPSGAILVFGCLSVLFVNVMNAPRR